MKRYEMVITSANVRIAEQAARVLDSMYRKVYNAYGGKRESSKRDGEYTIRLEYLATAETWKILTTAFYHKMAKIDNHDEVIYE